MNENYIELELSDEEVIASDDMNGNIVVPFIDNLTHGDKVLIHFKEDPDNIKHLYTVSLVDGPDAVIHLDWVKMVDNTLNEANPFNALKNKIKEKGSVANQIGKGLKGMEKSEEKTQTNAIKLAKRDLDSEGRYWTYYLQKDDGSYTDPMTQKQIVPYYQKMKETNKLAPAIANAFVVTENGYLVRRGMENLYRTGTKLTKDTSTIVDGYYMKVPSNNYTLDSRLIKETPEVHVADTKSAEGTKTSDKEETKSSDKEVTGTETELKSKTSGKLYISRAIIDKFQKLVNMTGLELVDASGAKIDASKLNTKNIKDAVVKSNGKQAELTTWLRTAVKDGLLTEEMLNEANIVLTPDELNDPKQFSIKDKIHQAIEAERIEKEEAEAAERSRVMLEKNKHIIEKINQSLHSNETPVETLEMIFDNIVPTSGPAESVAGELVRACMRILYRDYNDGDKFFEGYGIETCGSSAEYLFDNGLAENIQSIIDDAYRLTSDDDAYTSSIIELAKAVIDIIVENPSLLWEENTVDSRDYSTEYIEENQPRYEYSIEGSDDVVELVEKGVLTAWDLNHYVEEILDYSPACKGCSVDRPFTHTSTEVTVSELTKDGYDYLEDMLRHHSDSFWEDLVSEYSEELDNDDDYDDYDDDIEYSDDQD